MNSFVKYTVPGILILVGMILIGGSATYLKSGNFARALDLTDQSETIASAEEVSSIDLDIDMGDVTILPGNEFRYEAKNIDKDWLDIAVSGGVLEIDYQQKGWFHYLGLFHLLGDTDAEIVIYMPQKLYEQFTVKYGAGDFTVKGVTSSQASIHCGAGDFHAEDLRVEQSADIRCGVGDVDFINVTLVDPEIEAGVGDLSFENSAVTNMDLDAGVGDVNATSTALLGETNLDCGVGEIRLELRGDPADYDVDSDTGVGEIHSNDIGGKSAPNRIDIDGGVGSVDVIISQ